MCIFYLIDNEHKNLLSIVLLFLNHSEHAGWTAGESWTLGDSPAVGVVLDPDCGFYHETEAPIILDDTTNKFEKGRPKIRVYTSVDSRFILEDFIAKLEVLYGKGFDTK